MEVNVAALGKERAETLDLAACSGTGKAEAARLTVRWVSQ